MQITPIFMTREHQPAQVEINDKDNDLGISCSLQLALRADELRLQSTDPQVQPFLNYNYYTEPCDTLGAVSNSPALTPEGGRPMRAYSS